MNASATTPSKEGDGGNPILFWGCFIALITTSFAFFSRIYVCEVRIKDDFNLSGLELGELIGAGIWPFAISIILFSLFIDKIGYRTAMIFSCVCYGIYVVMACLAYGAVHGVEGAALEAAQAKGFSLLYWGSIILALGNGTVEAFINPVVATMFTKNKTKWLNILHAGWPGGLVIGGIIVIGMANIAAEGDWRLVLGIVAIPAVVYFLMLIGTEFPPNEREQAGVSYRDMLAEFGAFGAFVGFGLIFMQLGAVIPAWNIYVTIALTVVMTIGFGIYTQSVGRPILAFLIIIMMPLATTEIGTDGWIMGLMKAPMSAAGYDAGWVLVYTSAIMMILRFFAGPIVHTLSPIGLLVGSAVLAIAGLLALSMTGGQGLAVIFIAATLYGFGKTFFWPTMLGVTAEQCPKGGALTLNAISGIGMIAVGVLGFPFIGAVQDRAASAQLQEADETLWKTLATDSKYMGVSYKTLDADKVGVISEEDEKAKAKIEEAKTASQFSALAIMAIFPAFMLACYVGLFLYFKSQGGYEAEVLTGHAAEDAEYTGGVEGPADA